MIELAVGRDWHVLQGQTCGGFHRYVFLVLCFFSVPIKPQLEESHNIQ